MAEVSWVGGSRLRPLGWAAESNQKVTAGVFQQVQLLHLLSDNSVQNSKISAISGA
jgi:hypothetical protein